MTETSSTLVKQIITQSTHPMAWKDTAGRYVYCNDAFLKLLACLSADDIIDKQDHELPWSAAKQGHTEDSFNSTHTTSYFHGQDYHCDEITLSIAGDELGYLTSYHQHTVEAMLENNSSQLRQNADRSTKGLFSAHTTDQDESELNELSYFYESIIGFMPGNVYWLNRDCVLMGGNDNLASLFGLQSRSELKGLTYERMTALAGWNQKQGDSFRQDELEIMRTGQAKLGIEEPVISVNGKDQYYLGNKVPLRRKNGDIIGVLGISLDITERKQAEQSLVDLTEQLKESNRSKTEFIANMSHDLRTPITGMIGLLENTRHQLNQEKKEGKSWPIDLTELKAHTELLLEATHQLLNLSNDTLEVMSLELKQKKAELAPLNLNLLIKNVTKLLEPSAQHKQLILSCDIEKNLPAHLIGSSFYLNRILINLLSNAIKFTDSGSVNLSVLSYPIEEDPKSISVEIKITDTGIGIPEDKLDVIFNYFTKLTPSYKNTYQGSGLGLYTVKQYLKLIHGEINVTSKINHGTSFTVRVPMRLSKQPAKHESFDVTPLDVAQINSAHKPKNETQSAKIDKNISAESSTILLVEDNHIAALAVKLTLEALGYEVNVAKNSETAIEMAKQATYCLILMDVGLPDLDGFETTQKIRTFDSHTPIVGLTGHANTPEMAEKIKAYGMQAILTKPASQIDLTALLETYHKSPQTN
jgi:signal transduction histidine kinase/CheY-like chemotaxis protein